MCMTEQYTTKLIPKYFVLYFQWNGLINKIRNQEILSRYQVVAALTSSQVIPIHTEVSSNSSWRWDEWSNREEVVRCTASFRGMSEIEPPNFQFYLCSHRVSRWWQGLDGGSSVTISILGTTALRTSVKGPIAELGMEGMQGMAELTFEWITLAWKRGNEIFVARASKPEPSWIFS